MSAIKQQIEDLQNRFVALSQRERWLVLGACWALLAWLGMVLYESTAQASVIQREQEQHTLNQQLAAQEQLKAELTQAISGRSNNDYAQRLARLNMRLGELSAHVDERMSTLVEPDQMSGLLLTMLEQSEGLELLELSNQLPKRLHSDDTQEPLYQHDLSLLLSGSYMELLGYVKLLEQLSGRIFWRGLEFELKEYPQAIIRLDFFTISQHKELLRG